MSSNIQFSTNTETEQVIIKKNLQQWTNRISVCIDTFSSRIVGTLYHLKESLFKINIKTASNKKNNNNSNNKFMFVINNPKGTHLWLFSKNFSKKYSSSVWYILFTERENLIDLPYLEQGFI